jgi:hypothetical protein
MTTVGIYTARYAVVIEIGRVAHQSAGAEEGTRSRRDDEIAFRSLEKM